MKYERAAAGTGESGGKRFTFGETTEDAGRRRRTQEPQPSVHTCTLQNRAGLELTGVQEVVSFDENQVVLDTDYGLLTIKGSELHVRRLTVEKGEMDVDGKVDSLTYTSNEAYRKAGKSWISRLFG